MTKLFLTLLNVGITAGWLILAAWGMWDIKPALYDNEVKNCLVATYGIQGLAEKHDFFGYLDVYFNYDSEENYQILDLQFEEYDPTATVTDSSTDGDETAENQADSVAGAAASYEQVIGEYRDMVQNHFYMDLQAKDRDACEKSFEPGIGVKNPRFQPKNYDIYTS